MYHCREENKLAIARRTKGKKEWRKKLDYLEKLKFLTGATA